MVVTTVVVRGWLVPEESGLIRSGVAGSRVIGRNAGLGTGCWTWSAPVSVWLWPISIARSPNLCGLTERKSFGYSVHADYDGPILTAVAPTPNPSAVMQAPSEIDVPSR